MGLRSFGHGSSSSSSSTLSPLARPFTVNRASSKSKPSPPPHVFEDTFDFVPPRPSLDNYLRSQDPNPTLSSDSLPHSNRDVGSIPGYGYFGAQSIGSCGTHLPSLSPTTQDLSYGQHLKSVAHNVFGADPYYPHYPSAIHDNNAPVLKESGYGTLNSAAGPIDGSSQTAGFDCTTKWTDLWKNVDAPSSWKKPKGKVVSPYGSSLRLGPIVTEGFMACEETPSSWHKNFVDSSAKVNIGSTGNGPQRIDAKHAAISEANAGIPSFNLHNSSVLVPSTIQETIYSHIPDSSFMKAWNPFNQNTASYDGCFTPLDSCTTDPTIFYPSVAIQPIPPASGSSSSLGKVVLKDMEFCNRPMDAFNNKDSVGQASVKVKHPAERGLPLNLKSINANSLNDSLKKETELKLTHLKLPKTSTNAPGTDGPGDSVQSSSDSLNQLISAVDSPCWKGGASSRHSPFGVLDAEATISLAKEPEGWNDLSQHNHILPVNAHDAEAVSSPKLCGSLNYHETRGVENNSCPRKHPSVVSSLSAEHQPDGADKSGSDCSKAGYENGARCSGGLLIPGNGYVLPNSSESSSGHSGLKTSDVMPLSQEEVVTSAEKFMLQTRIKEPGMDFNTAQDGSSVFHSHDNELASNPSSSEGRIPYELAEIFRASDMSSQHSVPRLVVQMLVKTIHNLSELLISSFCNSILKENDCEAILLAIDNLVGLVRKLSKSIPDRGSSYCIRKSTDPHKLLATGGHHQATEVEADDIPTPSNHQSTLCCEGMMHSHLHRSCKKVDKLGGVARSGDMDFGKHMEMIQAVKKVIKHNICEQGENHPQTLLFKNLWIEAESALCSMTYELQLARMEIEMEKSKQHQAKAMKTIDVENLLSINVTRGIGGKETSASNAGK